MYEKKLKKEEVTKLHATIKEKIKNKLESEKRIKEVKNRNKEKRDIKERQLNAIQSQILLQKTIRSNNAISGVKRKKPETVSLTKGVSGTGSLNTPKTYGQANSGKQGVKYKKMKLETEQNKENKNLFPSKRSQNKDNGKVKEGKNKLSRPPTKVTPKVIVNQQAKFVRGNFLEH